MALKLAEWAKKVGLSDEAFEKVKDILAHSEEAIGKGYLAQEDYSRQMDERQKAYDEQVEGLNSQLKAVADLRAEAQKEREETGKAGKALEARMQKAEAQRDALVGRLEKDFGVSRQDLVSDLGDLQPEPKRGDSAPDFEALLAKSRTEAMQLANRTLDAGFEIDDLLDEHQELFGKRIRRAELAAKIREVAAQNPKVTNREVWEKTYGVAAKRDEIAKATRQKDIDAAVQEALVKDRTDRMMNPDRGGQAPDAYRSPVMRIEQDKTKRPASGVSDLARRGAEIVRQKLADRNAKQAGAAGKV